MSRNQWSLHYEKIKHKPPRDILTRAVALDESTCLKAIDVGCGVGVDAAYLLEHGYSVEAFDKEQSAIDLCKKRLGYSGPIQIFHARLEEYIYKQCGVLSANRSLYFCEPGMLEQVVENMLKAIEPGGVFVGDFLGFNDDWLRVAKGDVSPVQKEVLLAMFSSFNIVELIERDEMGSTVLGGTKHWHTYTLLAKKRSL